MGSGWWIRQIAIGHVCLRPGRLDKMLYIPLPAPAERAEIAAALVRSKPLVEGLDVQGIARDCCHGFSGADLSALVREAATNALKVWPFRHQACTQVLLRAHQASCQNGILSMDAAKENYIRESRLLWRRKV